MKRHMVVAFLLCTGILRATEEFAPKTYQHNDKSILNYRLYLPKDMDAEKRYPLVLFFHGAGERGNDNKKQLRHGAKDILAYSKKTDAPVIIIAPQCPAGAQWVNTPWGNLHHNMPAEPSNSMRLTIELIRESIRTMPVDRSRIYVTGLSMGGYGTWDIIQRHPDMFAAAIPICGGGDTAFAPNLTALPIWVFHGDKDKDVKTSRSRDMVESIKKAGGIPKYTEYKNVGHNSWSRTYANDDVMKWLFSQKKREQTDGAATQEPARSAAP